jgi:transcriptional regulator with XRE-family HTH domain
MSNETSKEVQLVNINEERMARGWSLQDVADRVGLSKVTIYRIETGKQDPSNKTYLKLMSLFGYNVPRLTRQSHGGEPSNPAKSIAHGKVEQ